MINKWPTTKISDISENLDSKRVPVARLKRKPGGIPYYGATGIVDYVDDYIFDEELLLIGEDGADWSGGANTAFTINGKCWVNNHAHVLRIKDANIQFVMNYLNYSDLRNYISGTTRGKLNQASLNKIKVPNPSLRIQQRIANILFSVDDDIEKTDQTIQKAEKLKQGLIQKLFNHKYKVVLDTVANRGSGHTPNKQHPEYWNGGIKWVSLADSSKLDKRYISGTDKEISLTGIENSSAVLHKKNTVIVCRDAAIGRVAILGSDNMAVSQHFIAWQCSEDLNFLYLYYWLQSQKSILEQIATGTTIRTIGLSFFKSLQIPLPSIQEQERVGDIFWSIDEKIMINQKLKAKLILLKKGLMQDIFSQKVGVN